MTVSDTAGSVPARRWRSRWTVAARGCSTSRRPWPRPRPGGASTPVRRRLRRSDPMASDFLMPKLGLTMEEGTITAWLVPDGTEVTAGMAVMVIETDKVETEVEASASGPLHQRGAVGETFPCGAVIGWIGDDAPAATAAAPAPAVAAPAAAVATAAPRPVAAAVNGGRRFISPNARRVA